MATQRESDLKINKCTLDYDVSESGVHFPMILIPSQGKVKILKSVQPFVVLTTCTTVDGKQNPEGGALITLTGNGFSGTFNDPVKINIGDFEVKGWVYKPNT